MDQPSPLSFENVKILFVDDEKLMLSMTKRKLNRLGYKEVEDHMNPHEAFEAFKANPLGYDLVITDFTFKGYDINGEDLIHMIRGVRSDIRVILLSGSGEYVNVSEKLPKDVIIVMKTELSELTSVIREVLG